jgi:hypothetical protein
MAPPKKKAKSSNDIAGAQAMAAFLRTGSLPGPPMAPPPQAATFTTAPFTSRASVPRYGGQIGEWLNTGSLKRAEPDTATL